MLVKQTVLNLVEHAHLASGCFRWQPFKHMSEQVNCVEQKGEGSNDTTLRYTGRYSGAPGITKPHCEWFCQDGIHVCCGPVVDTMMMKFRLSFKTPCIGTFLESWRLTSIITYPILVRFLNFLLLADFHITVPFWSLSDTLLIRLVHNIPYMESFVGFFFQFRPHFNCSDSSPVIFCLLEISPKSAQILPKKQILPNVP